MIDKAKGAVDGYCRKVGLAIGGRGPQPTENDYLDATGALDDLAALAAREPEAETSDQVTAELALGDIAEDLEATDCDPRLVERIDRALSELPAE